ncbi:MAG TPA: tRNA 2-thiouridine(34) synthase MnmA [Acidimicrobiales bacterium]|nr:tRNA 2-thiouridine(34) synthase MnmA [Acidimicrobiales bacterium]
MRVLVAMSGGVDSSVAAALLLEEGHQVVGATMKLWGSPSGSGCCSVADVEDARRVCQQLGIDHHVFNFTAEFERDVVAPYAKAHSEAKTPNPCIACNAHLKFDRFLERACVLGFEAIATGHHARVSFEPDDPYAVHGAWRLRRGRDAAKDQSYVLYMLGQDQLAHLRLPIGELTKQQVRALASAYGLRTAAKADSQDVCFISRSAGREQFLKDRIALGPGRLLARDGQLLGQVDALELVTVGQRRGLGLGLGAPSPPQRRYVLQVDLAERAATLGDLEDLLVSEARVADMKWSYGPLPTGVAVEAQLSAHGLPVQAMWGAGLVSFREPVRRVAPGQAVVLYGQDGGPVLGGGSAL